MTASDTLGFNTLRETVSVNLYDAKGKMPAKQAPQAKSQAPEAAPGEPVRVMLSGADPDGDYDLAPFRELRYGFLKPGYGGSPGQLGPELGFGHVMEMPPRLRFSSSRRPGEATAWGTNSCLRASAGTPGRSNPTPNYESVTGAGGK